MMRPSAYAGILKLFTPRGRDHPPSLKLRRTGRSTRLNSSQARLQCATGILPVLLITACTHTSNVQHVPGAVDTRAAARASVRRALDYLESSQIDAQEEAESGMFAGGWPQQSKFVGIRRSENSPFYVSFIHHALCQLTPGNARALGLARGDLARARTVRAAAIAMMRRFETKPPTSFPGSYGFWPRAESVPEPAQGGVWPFVHKWFTMPAPGDLAPLHQKRLPRELMLPPDADDTAMIYVSLLLDSRIDGGPRPSTGFHRHFSKRRDLGNIPLQFPADLEPGTGAFLTWFPEPEFADHAGEIDLAVNANILHCLGMFGLLDRTAGVGDAIRLINKSTRSGRYKNTILICKFYPDNYVYHFLVARAFDEGRVRGLRPAVRILADEVEADARSLPGGRVFWDRGDPHINTALAMLTLLHAGRRPDMVEGAARYLVSEQRPRDGAWDESYFFGGFSPFYIRWFSRPATSAVCLEALCRYLVNPPRSAPRTTR